MEAKLDSIATRMHSTHVRTILAKITKTRKKIAHRNKNTTHLVKFSQAVQVAIILKTHARDFFVLLMRHVTQRMITIPHYKLVEKLGFVPRTVLSKLRVRSAKFTFSVILTIMYASGREMMNMEVSQLSAEMVIEQLPQCFHF